MITRSMLSSIDLWIEKPGERNELPDWAYLVRKLYKSSLFSLTILISIINLISIVTEECKAKVYIMYIKV